MMKNLTLITTILIATTFIAVASPVHAKPLTSRVNEAFRSVFRRNPIVKENQYWLGRVFRGEKKTYEALRGAMFYHKARGRTMGQSEKVKGARIGSGKVPFTASNKKQDLIKNVLPLFVNIYGNDPTKAEKAWWRKRINCNEITTHKALVSSMSFHKSKKARKGSDAICGGKSVSSSAGSGILRKQVAGISTHPFGNHVRIGIFYTDGSPIVVTADKKFQVREGQSKVVATLGKDDEVQVSWSSEEYHVRGSGLSIDTKNVIRLVPLELGIMKIKNYIDKSKTIPGKNYNRFRGIIEVRKSSSRNELWAINDIRTEYYLRGLAESSDSGPEEYLKALGVAARTYVLYHKVITGGRRQDAKFDIGRTADDQIYRGYEYEIITPRLASIFNKTKGIIVTDGEADKPVSTVYFSDSDGRTRSAKEKWGTSKFPHLQQSVKDPHHIASTCVGHCVGMSAQGAYGFAKKDRWSFQKILKYFYKGVNIIKAY